MFQRCSLRVLQILIVCAHGIIENTDSDKVYDSTITVATLHDVYTYKPQNASVVTGIPTTITDANTETVPVTTQYGSKTHIRPPASQVVVLSTTTKKAETMTLPASSTRSSKYGHLSLTVPDVAHCLTGDEYLRFKAYSGRISLRSEDSVNGSMCCPYCTLHVEVPPRMFVHVQFLELNTPCTRSGTIYLYRWSSDENRWVHLPCGKMGIIADSFSEINGFDVHIDINRDIFDRPFVLDLNFTAVSEIPGLELKYISPKAGFIQSPGWSLGKKRPINMNSRITLEVPRHHSLFLSVPVIQFGNRHCHADTLELYNMKPDRTLNAKLCDPSVTEPSLYQESVYEIHYKTNDEFDKPSDKKGFRLIFSFHNQSALPELVANRRWNCSVPHWVDFQDHFDCDLYPDCDGGEDERDCAYTSITCGEGYISAGSSCYRLVYPSSRVTIVTAESKCRQLGMTLAGLETLDEWNNVMQLLQSSRLRQVLTGLKSSRLRLPKMYKHMLQWTSGVIAHSLQKRESGSRLSCFLLYRGGSQVHITKPSCTSIYLTTAREDAILCEKPSTSVSNDLQSSPTAASPDLPAPNIIWPNDTFIKCPNDHVTLRFLGCSDDSVCLSGACQNTQWRSPPAFTCSNNVEHIPYTFLCDHAEDCQDRSDETFCEFQPCNEQFQCGDGQCIPKQHQCDGQEDCWNGSDEKGCNVSSLEGPLPVPPPVIVTFDKDTKHFKTKPLPCDSQTGTCECPDTHYRCSEVDFCLPIYTRCNDVLDCPGQEDEVACDSYTCAGFYSCHGSRICLHHDHICDGIYHCPRRDDELLCAFTCPTYCSCDGLAAFCERGFLGNGTTQLRYLDARRTGLKLEHVQQNRMLVYLSLAECGLITTGYSSFPNLLTLDLSKNRLMDISWDDVSRFPRLATLILAGNPLTSIFVRPSSAGVLQSNLHVLDLSGVRIPILNASVFVIFPRLHTLNLSHSRLHIVSEEGFKPLRQLRVLDLRGCSLTEFPSDIFSGLETMSTVHASNYKLCCPAVLPTGFNRFGCDAPADELSSCEALLRSDVYRVFLSVFASLALTGNLGSFAYRTVLNRTIGKSGFGVFVTHLCVADFIMGVYLAIIGVSDRAYYGTYLWHDSHWLKSAACKAAGFLSFLSSEVSAFLICLITLDRFLALRFPFSQYHFGKRSAHVACCVVWAGGLVVAMVPLLPNTQHWNFYGQSAICIPLPVTRQNFPGQDYSFGVMIVLNFILVVLIAAGQVSIYMSIKANQMSSQDSSRKASDATIAHRLLTIAMSDFLCWFPIGLLGLLAVNGVPISGEINVAMAVFVLPVNSAVNPFLYTVNIILEKRKLKEEKRLRMHLQRKLDEKD